MASAALLARLRADDPLLEFPAHAAEWSAGDVQAFYDSCGQWTPDTAWPELEPEPELGTGPGPGPGPGPGWGLGYRVGPAHRLISGDAEPARHRGARLRLFCFLWTGGTAGYFERLLQPRFAAAGAVEVVAVNLPGRERAADLPLADTWPGLVALLTDALMERPPGGPSWLEAMPFAFFGHSLGAVRALLGRLSGLSVAHSESVLYGAFVWARRALHGGCWRGQWVAYELALELRRRGAPSPVHLLVSAKYPPQANAAERAHAQAMLAAGGPGYAAARLGLGRIVTLHYHSFILYQIR
jgi:hypothetical protein